MARKHSSLVVLWGSLCLAAPAAAQSADAPGADAERRPADPRAATDASPDAEVSLPEVDDRMLDPLPPPDQVLRSWQQAVRLVQARSTDLHISQAQVLQASGRARQALAAALPLLTGSARVDRHLLFGTGVNFGAEGVEQNARIPDPATNFTASIGLRQPLLALGSWYAVGTARYRTRAAELTAQDLERLLLATVAESAVGVITAERVSQVSRVSLDSALSTFELTRRRAELGAASTFDVLRAEQEVELSRVQVVSADEALMQAREALGRALGYSGPWGVVPDLRIAELTTTAETLCEPLDTIAGRADVRAARVNVEIAERQEQAVDYRYAPTLDLTSQLSYLGNLNRSPNGEHVTWTVGAILEWPIYDGGDRQGDRTAAQADTAIAQEQLTETQRAARFEVVQTLRAVRVARANLAVSRRAQRIAKESARLARVAFVNGSGTSFDLVDSARRLREAEIDLALQEFELVRARIAAFLAQSNCAI